MIWLSLAAWALLVAHAVGAWFRAGDILDDAHALLDAPDRGQQ